MKNKVDEYFFALKQKISNWPEFEAKIRSNLKVDETIQIQKFEELLVPYGVKLN